jgi:hypothetical protein
MFYDRAVNGPILFTCQIKCSYCISWYPLQDYLIGMDSAICDNLWLYQLLWVLVVNHNRFYINPYQDGNQRWQLQLGVGVNSAVGIVFHKSWSEVEFEFIKIYLELDLMHFVNSNLTPFDVVVCSVKMRKIENVTTLSYFSDKQEVLLSFKSFLRVVQVDSTNKNKCLIHLNGEVWESFLKDTSFFFKLELVQSLFWQAIIKNNK